MQVHSHLHRFANPFLIQNYYVVAVERCESALGFDSKKFRPGGFFFHYGIGKRDGQADGKIRGGDSLFGRLAVLQKTFGLSHTELLEESWIGLNLKMADMPYFDYESSDVIKITDKEQARNTLEKYKNRK